MTKLTYDVLYSERPTVIGDPEEAIRRIENMNRVLGIDEFVSFVNFGGMEHALTLKSMELFATQVNPTFSVVAGIQPTLTLTASARGLSM